MVANAYSFRIGLNALGFRITRFTIGCIDTDGLWIERLLSR